MFYHLVCVDKLGFIEDKNSPIWFANEIKKYYPKLIKAAPIIIGKKSFESLPFLQSFSNKIFVISKELPLSRAMQETQDESAVYIIGGQSIFEQTIDMIEGVILLQVDRICSMGTIYYRFGNDMRLKLRTNFGKNQLLRFDREWQYDN